VETKECCCPPLLDLKQGQGELQENVKSIYQKKIQSPHVIKNLKKNEREIPLEISSWPMKGLLSSLPASRCLLATVKHDKVGAKVNK